MLFYSSAMRRLFARSSLAIAVSAACAANAAPVLEEVLVTAQKRAQSAQDIPVAVTGLGGDQLDKLGFENATDVSAQVPNMQVSGPYGDVQPIFSIRGVSMSDYSSNQASPIGVYVDEAYLAPVYSHGANFFDVERLEVLRGPQGTLYGKNTTGGAINLITRTPGFDEGPSAYVKLGAGKYGATTAEAAGEMELIPGVLSGRLAASAKRNDGYVEIVGKDANGAQTDFLGGRMVLNWRINESWDAVLRYTKSGNDSLSTPPRNEPRTDVRGPLQGDSNGYIDYIGYSRPSRGLDFHETEANRVGALVTNTDLAVLTVNYNADNYTLTSVTSYLDADYSQAADTDGSPNGLLEITWGSDSISYSQDLRFTSNFDGMFNIIAGVFYSEETMDMNNLYDIYDQIPDLRVGVSRPDNIPIFPYLLDFGQLDQRMITEKTSAAAYTQMRFDFTANFGMDLGLRYTRDENRLTYLNISRLTNDGEPVGSYVPGNNTGVDNGWITLPLTITDLQDLLSDPLGSLAELLQVGYTHGPYTTASAKQLEAVENEWTGKLGLDYRFNDEWMVYTSISRGYRSGSFNGGVYYEERPLETAYAAPEYIDAYEVGFKADLFENSMRLNVAAFLYDYTDQQFINVVNLSNFLENAGGSSIQGVEAELWARVTERLTLQLAVGYLETEYSELTLANTETIADTDDTVDLAGNELISAPKWNYSISADYDLLVLESGYLSLNVNANFQDDQWYSAYNDDNGYGEIGQDAYWLYNARLSWYASDDSYSISLWGKNLADEEYDVYAINLQAGFGFDQYLAGEPRSYGAEVTLRF